MKLIFCTKCTDVFSLSKELKSCSCGETSGKYLDNLNAEYYGDRSVPLGFDNFDLSYALNHQPSEGMGKDFVAFVIPKKCPTFIHRGKNPS